MVTKWVIKFFLVTGNSKKKKNYIETVNILFDDQLHISLQGNFSTCLVGTYKLVWDNSYSTFFKKVGQWFTSPHDMIFTVSFVGVQLSIWYAPLSPALFTMVNSAQSLRSVDSDLSVKGHLCSVHKFEIQLEFDYDKLLFPSSAMLLLFKQLNGRARLVSCTIESKVKCIGHGRIV